MVQGVHIEGSRQSRQRGWSTGDVMGTGETVTQDAVERGVKS